MDATSTVKRTLPPDSQSGPPKIKCRKGTRSCWQCKRRKVRCNFASNREDICDSCKIRNTACISQEFPEQTSHEISNNNLYDRLGRVESLVDRLARKVDSADGINDGLQSPRDSDDLDLRVRPSTRTVIRNPLTPQKHDGTTMQQLASNSTRSEAYIIQEREPIQSKESGSLSRLLLNAWPDRWTLETLRDLPANIYGVFHGAMCARPSKKEYKSSISVQKILEVPPVGSHPVVIARRLLMLATYLQNLSPDYSRRLEKSGVDHRKLVSQVFETARSYVTSNEELLGSIESVECLLIESMYQNNAGNLRSAWHSIRRAMLLAQMMDLHRSNGIQPLEFVESETQTRVDPEYLWFRLMSMNRYLSLVLGMLQGTPNNRFADSDILESCTPQERMQRMDCVVGGHILQRNEAGLYDTATTHMIDQLLQRSGACVPQSWWTIPDLELTIESEERALEDLIRNVDQLVHYHLVLQVHLPHLLRLYSEHEYDYSKIVAMNASREILIRYTSLNGVHAFTSWCRGISFLAFIASVAMMIMHADAKHQQGGFNQGDGALLDILKSQYQRDRSMIELSLDCMQRTARESKDAIASKAAVVLKHLLSMEAGNALCEQIATHSSAGGLERVVGCDGRISEFGDVLHIHLPSFGTVKFERSSNEDVSIRLP